MLTIEERNDLILNHVSFADSIAKNQFRKNSQTNLDELKSAAYMGLVDAASKYDGFTPFLAYASYRISGEIKDYMRSIRLGGRKWGTKFYQWDEQYEFAAEPEPENFSDSFDELTRDVSDIGKKVLWMYYAQDMTLKEIGEKVNLSKTRIHQLLKTNLDYLRDSDVG
jgi:RNA polymerase sigma factor (sigma-70 family)